MIITRPKVTVQAFLMPAYSSRYCSQPNVSKSAFMNRATIPFPNFSTKRRHWSTFRKSSITMMPEGPEVRTLVNQLQPAVGMRLVDIRFLSGRYVTHGRPVGYDSFARTMTPYSNPNSNSNKDVSIPKEDDSGTVVTQRNRVLPVDVNVDVITQWNAKGKFMYLQLDNGRMDKPRVSEEENDYKRSIWITLGMTGRFVHETHPKMNQARWVMILVDPKTGTWTKLYYVDPRNFGTLKFSTSALELDTKLQSLGVDILEKETSVEMFWEIVDKQRNPNLNICKFLMDQTKISGVGNYILSEGLYRANIDPFAGINELSKTQLSTLFHEIQSTALESLASQGMTRSKGGSYRNVDGERGQYEFQLQCYGREFCSKGRPVIRETNGPHKRTIWYTEDQLFVPRSERGDDGSLVVEKQYSPTLLENSGSMSENNVNLSEFVTEPTWKSALSETLSSPTLYTLSNIIAKERAQGHTIYPPPSQTFSALNLCPLDKVKVVIVGQDPYHGPNQGHGLAFSVLPGIPIPPSLQNIFKELEDDLGIPSPSFSSSNTKTRTPNGSLESWAKQGVLLLNTVLTVRRGEANSHKNLGWEEITSEILSKVVQTQPHVVLLLWGNPAAKKAHNVFLSRRDTVETEKQHDCIIIQCSHPSPLSARRTKHPFLGSRCFSRANEALIGFGLEPIDWSIR